VDKDPVARQTKFDKALLPLCLEVDVRRLLVSAFNENIVQQINDFNVCPA
jgi:hypothetical protein